MKGDLYRFYLLGITKSFKEECDSSFIEDSHIPDIDGLSDFLDKGKNLAIIRDNGGIKKQVYKKIKELNIKLDEWFYLPCYSSEMEYIEMILKGSIGKIFIIDCRDGFDDEAKKRVEDISRLITNKPTELDEKKEGKEDKGNKKLILLMKEGEKFETPSELKHVDLETKELEDPQILKIFKKYCEKYEDKYFSLGGKFHKVSDIIKGSEDKVGHIYNLIRNLDYLEQFIDKSVDAREVVQKSEIPYGVYIANSMSQGNFLYKFSIILDRIADIYVIEGIKPSDLESEINAICKKQERKEGYFHSQYSSMPGEEVEDDVKLVLLSKAEDIETYESKAVVIVTKRPSNEFLKDKKYVHLQYDEKKLLFKVIEKSDEVILRGHDEIDFTEQKEQEVFIDAISSRSQMSIISSDAGFGKTSYCINRLESHKMGEKLPVWCVKIPLPKLEFDSKGIANLTPFIRFNSQLEEEAYKLDLKKGRVFFILDGFDELKDKSIIEAVNEFIREKCGSNPLLVTTRGYASHKIEMIQSRKIVFYRLHKYTQEQREEYVKKYIEKIVLEDKTKGEEKEWLESEVVKHLKNQFILLIGEKLPKHTSDVLGIPLQSFLFCESLKPEVKKYIASRKDSSDCIEEFVIESDVGTISKLFQEFVLSKYILFLQKHLRMDIKTTPEKTLVLSLMGSYSQVLELFALKQAFQSEDKMEDKKIEKLVKACNFNLLSLESLNDTGLLTISYEGKKIKEVKFSHETYQEFYSALALIRGISGSGEMNKFVKTIIKEHRYNPKFSLIISIACQLSLYDVAMVPGYEVDEHMEKFWTVLIEDGDLYGAGTVRLLVNAISGFKAEERESLSKKIEDKDWHKFLKTAIKIKASEFNNEDSREGTQAFDPGSVLQMTDSERDYYQQFKDEKVFDEAISKILSLEKRYDVKMGLLDFYKKLSEHGAITKYMVDKLEEVEIKKYEDRSDWSIEVVGYLGEFFCEVNAKFLIDSYIYTTTHSYVTPTDKWLRQKILNAIDEVYNLTTYHLEARKNLFWVICKIHNYYLKDSSLASDFKKLLKKVDEDFLDYFIENLEDFLKEDCDLITPEKLKEIIEEIKEKVKIIIVSAKVLGYAITKKEKDHEVIISLEKESKLEITFNKTDNLQKIFHDSILKAIEEEKKNKEYLHDYYDISIIVPEYDALEKQVYQQFKDEKVFDEAFNKIFFENIHPWPKKLKLLDFYKKLSEHGAITKYMVDKLEKDEIKKYKDPGDWSIEVMKYTGQFFSNVNAKFLIDSYIETSSHRSVTNHDKYLREKIFSTIGKIYESTADYFDARKNCLLVIKYLKGCFISENIDDDSMHYFFELLIKLDPGAEGYLTDKYKEKTDSGKCAEDYLTDKYKEKTDSGKCAEDYLTDNYKEKTDSGKFKYNYSDSDPKIIEILDKVIKGELSRKRGRPEGSDAIAESEESDEGDDTSQPNKKGRKAEKKEQDESGAGSSEVFDASTTTSDLVVYVDASTTTDGARLAGDLDCHES